MHHLKVREQILVAWTTSTFTFNFTPMMRFKQLFLLSLSILSLQPNLFARTKVPVQKEPDIPLEGPSAPSRAPSREDSLFDVYIEGSYLFIETTSLFDVVYCVIINPEDNTIILSEVNYAVNDELVFDLSSMQTGTYTLSLQINEMQYRGILFVE